MWKVGQLVRIKHTGEDGLIVKDLGDSMVMVRLKADGDEIPVFTDDLGLPLEVPVKPSISMAANTLQPQKSSADLKKLTEPVQQYTLLKDIGLYIAFEPVFDSKGETERYEVHAINGTKYNLAVQVEVEVAGEIIASWDGMISSKNKEVLPSLYFEELNDSPQYAFELTKLTTAGAETMERKVLKIKAKQFFNKLATAPLLNRLCHLYLLVTPQELDKKDDEMDLMTYTKRIDAAPKKGKSSHGRKISLVDLQAFAAFNTELDLHIEKIVSDASKLKQHDILRTQLNAFEEYIEQAIRLGINRVFIIHGIGEGRLKQAIGRRLEENKQVVKFVNEYHPKYGWGATEVFL